MELNHLAIIAPILGADGTGGGHFAGYFKSLAALKAAVKKPVPSKSFGFVEEDRKNKVYLYYVPDGFTLGWHEYSIGSGFRLDPNPPQSVEDGATGFDVNLFKGSSEENALEKVTAHFVLEGGKYLEPYQKDQLLMIVLEYGTPKVISYRSYFKDSWINPFGAEFHDIVLRDHSYRELRDGDDIVLLKNTTIEPGDGIQFGTSGGFTPSGDPFLTRTINTIAIPENFLNVWHEPADHSITARKVGTGDDAKVELKAHTNYDEVADHLESTQGTIVTNALEVDLPDGSKKTMVNQTIDAWQMEKLFSAGHGVIIEPHTSADDVRQIQISAAGSVAPGKDESDFMGVFDTREALIAAAKNLIISFSRDKISGMVRLPSPTSSEMTLGYNLWRWISEIKNPTSDQIENDGNWDRTLLSARGHGVRSLGPGSHFPDWRPDRTTTYPATNYPGQIIWYTDDGHIEEAVHYYSDGTTWHKLNTAGSALSVGADRGDVQHDVLDLKILGGVGIGTEIERVGDNVQVKIGSSLQVTRADVESEYDDVSASQRIVFEQGPGVEIQTHEDETRPGTAIVKFNVTGGGGTGDDAFKGWFDRLEDFPTVGITPHSSYAYLLTRSVPGTGKLKDSPQLYRYTQRTGSGVGPQWYADYHAGFVEVNAGSHIVNNYANGFTFKGDDTRAKMLADDKLEVDLGLRGQILGVSEGWISKLVVNPDGSGSSINAEGVMSIGTSSPLLAQTDAGAKKVKVVMAGQGVEFEYTPGSTELGDLKIKAIPVVSAKIGTTTNIVDQVNVDSEIASFEEENKVLKIKAVSGTTNGTTGKISAIKVTNNATAVSEMKDGVLSINIPSGSGGTPGVPSNQIIVKGVNPDHFQAEFTADAVDFGEGVIVSQITEDGKVRAQVKTEDKVQSVFLGVFDTRVDLLAAAGDCQIEFKNGRVIGHIRKVDPIATDVTLGYYIWTWSGGPTTDKTAKMNPDNWHHSAGTMIFSGGTNMPLFGKNAADESMKNWKPIVGSDTNYVASKHRGQLVYWTKQDGDVSPFTTGHYYSNGAIWNKVKFDSKSSTLTLKTEGEADVSFNSITNSGKYAFVKDGSLDLGIQSYSFLGFYESTSAMKAKVKEWKRFFESNVTYALIRKASAADNNETRFYTVHLWKGPTPTVDPKDVTNAMIDDPNNWETHNTISGGGFSIGYFGTGSQRYPDWRPDNASNTAAVYKGQIIWYGGTTVTSSPYQDPGHYVSDGTKWTRIDFADTPDESVFVGIFDGQTPMLEAASKIKTKFKKGQITAFVRKSGDEPGSTFTSAFTVWKWSSDNESPTSVQIKEPSNWNKDDWISTTGYATVPLGTGSAVPSWTPTSGEGHPAANHKGQIVYFYNDKKHYYSDGTSWKKLVDGSGPTPGGNPGEIIVAENKVALDAISAADKTNRLAVTTSDTTFYYSNGTTWQPWGYMHMGWDAASNKRRYAGTITEKSYNVEVDKKSGTYFLNAAEAAAKLKTDGSEDGWVQNYYTSDDKQSQVWHGAITGKMQKRFMQVSGEWSLWDELGSTVANSMEIKGKKADGTPIDQTPTPILEFDSTFVTTVLKDTGTGATTGIKMQAKGVNFSGKQADGTWLNKSDQRDLKFEGGLTASYGEEDKTFKIASTRDVYVKGGHTNEAGATVAYQNYVGMIDFDKDNFELTDSKDVLHGNTATLKTKGIEVSGPDATGTSETIRNVKEIHFDGDAVKIEKVGSAATVTITGGAGGTPDESTFLGIFESTEELYDAAKLLVHAPFKVNQVTGLVRNEGETEGGEKPTIGYIVYRWKGTNENPSADDKGNPENWDGDNETAAYGRAIIKVGTDTSYADWTPTADTSYPANQNHGQIVYYTVDKKHYFSNGDAWRLLEGETGISGIDLKVNSGEPGATDEGPYNAISKIKFQNFNYSSETVGETNWQVLKPNIVVTGKNLGNEEQTMAGPSVKFEGGVQIHQDTTTKVVTAKVGMKVTGTPKPSPDVRATSYTGVSDIELKGGTIENKDGRIVYTPTPAINGSLKATAVDMTAATPDDEGYQGITYIKSIGDKSLSLVKEHVVTDAEGRTTTQYELTIGSKEPVLAVTHLSALDTTYPPTEYKNRLAVVEKSTVVGTPNNHDKFFYCDGASWEQWGYSDMDDDITDLQSRFPKVMGPKEYTEETSKHLGYQAISAEDAEKKLGIPVPEEGVLQNQFMTNTKWIQTFSGITTGNIWTRVHDVGADWMDWRLISGVDDSYYSVLTTHNDDRFDKYHDGSAPLAYRVLQDPRSNVFSNQHGLFGVRNKGHYNITVGLHLTGQNDWLSHVTKFKFTLKNAATGTDLVVPIEGNVTAGGSGEYPGAYPTIECTFKNVPLEGFNPVTGEGEGCEIRVVATGESGNIDQSFLDPYKNFLVIEPSSSLFKTGLNTALSLRDSLAGLSFTLGSEVRAEKYGSSDRAVGYRYNPAIFDITPKS